MQKAQQHNRDAGKAATQARAPALANVWLACKKGCQQQVFTHGTLTSYQEGQSAAELQVELRA